MSAYQKRFVTGWSEQVMLAADTFAAACAEAHPHNNGTGTPTLHYAMKELAMALRDKMFSREEITEALKWAEGSVSGL